MLRGIELPMIEAARRRVRGVSRSLAVKLVLGLAVLALLSSTVVPASATSPLGHVSVSGTDLLADGQQLGPLRGFNDATVLEFQVMAYLAGQPSYAGENQNFPYPAGQEPPGQPSQPRLSCASSAAFWDLYFSLAHHYGFNLVRLGPCGDWNIAIDYQAWHDDPAGYYSFLGEMLDAAANHSVYVNLILAGGDSFDFGGSGSAFNVSSSAYSRYIAYAQAVMVALADYDALAFYDMWNEPEATDYFGVGNPGPTQIAFRTWARTVANATLAASLISHPRTMGVGDGGDLNGNWHWGYGSFYNCTGGTGFEITSRHIYASANDAYLFHDAQAWSTTVGKPYFVGEVARNNVTPMVRWTYAEQKIEYYGAVGWASMVITGTSDYPASQGLIESLLDVIIIPIIDAVILAMGSSYGLVGIGIGAVLLVGGLLTRHWLVALLGLAVLILTLIFIGGLLAL